MGNFSMSSDRYERIMCEKDGKDEMIFKSPHSVNFCDLESYTHQQENNPVPLVPQEESRIIDLIEKHDHYRCLISDYTELKTRGLNLKNQTTIQSSGLKHRIEEFGLSYLDDIAKSLIDIVSSSAQIPYLPPKAEIIADLCNNLAAQGFESYPSEHEVASLLRYCYANVDRMESVSIASKSLQKSGSNLLHSVFSMGRLRSLFTNAEKAFDFDDSRIVPLLGDKKLTPISMVDVNVPQLHGVSEEDLVMINVSSSENLKRRAPKQRSNQNSVNTIPELATLRNANPKVKEIKWML